MAGGPSNGSSAVSGKKSRWAGRLIDYEDLPPWHKDNSLIRTGYRRPGSEEEKSESDGQLNDNKRPFRHDSYAKCWTSIWCYCHNESVNIHTHLWGALFSFLAAFLHLLHHFFPTFFSALSLPHSFTHNSLFDSPALHPPAAHLLQERAERREPEWKDVAGFTTFLLGAVLCLGFSASFHSCGCQSREAYRRFQRFDYIGIVVLTVGSFYPALHYGFYCYPRLQLFYSVLITINGVATTSTVIIPKYGTPKFRPVRTCLFLGLGLSAVFPVMHVVGKYGYATVAHTMGVNYLILSGALYVIGACLYMTHIPERYVPGRFDYFGASHQIFHVLILLAAFSHYVCIRRAYAFWHTVDVIGGPAGVEGVCLALEGMGGGR